MDKALGRLFTNLCYDGTQKDLNLTYNTRSYVLAADLVAGELFTSKEIVPKVDAGFSFVEHVALTLAEPIKQDDRFSMVQVRLNAIQEVGNNTFIESNLGRTLSGFVKKLLSGIKYYRGENLRTQNFSLEAVGK